MARPRKHRHWSAEEKGSICLQTRAPEVSVAQVARRYALNANLIFKWLKDPRYAPRDTPCDRPDFLPVEISTQASADLVPVIDVGSRRSRMNSRRQFTGVPRN
jgi:transposase